MIYPLVRAGVAALVLGLFASSGGAQTPNVKLTLDFAIQGQQSHWPPKAATLRARA